MYKLAVIGNPISHSMSPTIFGMFARQCSIDLVYDKILANDINGFNQIVTDFFKSGGLALNITSPFKQDAFKIANIATARAKFCGAANFLRLDKAGDILADTTDGIGLVKDIEQNQGFKLNGKNILILGSGFVLDSILLDLIQANPLSIDILARNQPRMDYLKNKFGVGGFSQTTKYDFILNTVPNTSENLLLSQIEELDINAFCYDMAYSKFTEKQFYQYIKQINPQVNISSGIGMLAEVSKVAFTQLFTKSPNTHQVIEDLT